jgi:hypothetical protein
VRAFGSGKSGDEGIDFIAADKTLAGYLIEAGAHAVEFEFAHGFQNLSVFHQGKRESETTAHFA